MACPTCGSRSPFVCERLRGKKLREYAYAHPWEWHNSECCEDSFHTNSGQFTRRRDGWLYVPKKGRC